MKSLSAYYKKSGICDTNKVFLTSPDDSSELEKARKRAEEAQAEYKLLLLECNKAAIRANEEMAIYKNLLIENIENLKATYAKIEEENSQLVDKIIETYKAISKSMAKSDKVTKK